LGERAGWWLHVHVNFLALLDIVCIGRRISVFAGNIYLTLKRIPEFKVTFPVGSKQNPKGLVLRTLLQKFQCLY
jgi:hypothetical protein